MAIRSDYRRHMLAPLLVLTVFILLQLSGLIDTKLLTRENEYAAVILMQIVIFILPAMLYMSLTGGNLSTLRLRPIGLGHIPIMASAVFALVSGSVLLNLANTGYDSLSSGFDLYGIFISKSDGSAGNTIYLMLAYALLPAICEEYTFRAVLCGEYEKNGTLAAIIMPSVFFAMLHFDFRMFPTYFLAGIVLALVFYACRSILASITVHFCFNMISLFGRSFLRTLYDLGGKTLFDFMCVAVFLLSAFIFCTDAARLYKTYSQQNLSSEYRNITPRRQRSQTPNAAEEFAIRHPAITAFSSSVFHPCALACYIFYIIIILF